MTNQNIANVVVAILKEVEMDGEMMEWIINQVGMRDQMIKQLVTNKEEMNDGVIMASFTKDALIEYTRTIQERCKVGVVEVVKNSGIAYDEMVELSLDYREVTIEFDEYQLHNEIESVIDDAFEVDDDAVFDEVCDVIENMKKV